MRAEVLTSCAPSVRRTASARPLIGLRHGRLGDWLFLIIGIAVVGVAPSSACSTSRRRQEPVRRGAAPTSSRRPTEAPAEARRGAADARPRPPRRRRSRRWSARRVRRAGWSGCASGSPAPRARLGHGAARAALPRPPRRGHLGGDRGHPAHRRHRRRPDPGAGRAAAHPAPRRGRRGRHRPRDVLREELLDLVDPTMDRAPGDQRRATASPAVVLVVGVNGTGKTTTVGKLARVLVAEDQHVGARRGRHVPRRRRRAAGHLGRAGRRPTSSAVPRAPTRRASPSRRSARASSRRPTWCSSTPPAGCRTRPA